MARPTLNIAERTVVGLGLAILVAAPASAMTTPTVTTPIFKCTDPNGAVLYTDEPCNGGQQLDIRPGSADPTAIQRLERAQDLLDRSAAELRDAARREELARPQRQAFETQPAVAYGTANQDYYYPAWGWYPVFVHPRHLPHRPHKLHASTHISPKLPHRMPRP